jgi:hypothetical protein
MTEKLDLRRIFGPKTEKHRDLLNRVTKNFVVFLFPAGAMKSREWR